jgi:hypothetical protein
MVRVSEAKFFRAPMQFAKHIQACLVEGRVAPSGGCLRSPDGEAAMVPRYVLPLEPFDLAAA